MQWRLVVLLMAIGGLTIWWWLAVGPQNKHNADLEFWCYSGGGAGDPTTAYWQGVGKRFESETGSRVKIVTGIPQSHFTAMLASRSLAGKPPDVVYLDDNYLPELVADGALLSLDDAITGANNFDLQDYAPSMVREGQIDGQQYSVPWAGMFIMLTVRTDLLQQAGVDIPRTWDELLHCCQQLRERCGLQHPFATDISAWRMVNYGWQCGGSVASSDGRRILVNDPAWHKAFQFIHDLMHKHGYMDPKLAQGAKKGDKWSSGEIALMVDGVWNLGRYDDKYPQWQGKWTVAPMPAGDKQVSFYGGQHLVISKETRRPQLAWDFVQFATNRNNQQAWVDELGKPPANLTVLDQPAFKERHPKLAAMRAAISHGRNFPMIPMWKKLWGEVFTERVIEAVWEKDADIPALLDAGQGAMQAVLDGYWERHDALHGSKGGG